MTARTRYHGHVRERRGALRWARSSGAMTPLSTFDARAFAQSLLAPGERLIWAEAAPAAPAFWGGLVLALAGTLLAGGAAFFVYKQARRALEALREAAFGKAFLGALTACFIAIFLLAFAVMDALGWNHALSAGSSVYAVTDQRLFQAGRGVTTWVDAFEPGALSATAEGGDVVIYQHEDGDAVSYARPREALRFYAVENPSRIAALISETLPRAVPPAPATPAHSIDAAAARALAPSLRAGERLLWTQRAPDFSWSNVNPGTLLFIAFWTTIWAYFLYFLYRGLFSAFLGGKRASADEVAALGMGPLLMLFAATAIFTLAGIAPTLSELRRQSVTAYGVTNERALILSALPWREVRSFGPEAFDQIAHGEDWLAFDYRRGKARGYRGRFRDVPDPAAVEALIRAEIAPATD